MAQEEKAMITAVALYTGRSLSDFRLLGLTTRPDLVAEIKEIIARDDPRLLKTKAQRSSGRAPLKLITHGEQDES
jgi:hypothetical protein